MDQCVVGLTHEAPGMLRGLVRSVVVAMVRAGLPVSSREADAQPLSPGVLLSVVPALGSFALQVAWQQHPALEVHGSLWRVQQTAMHEAVRTILAAQGFLLSEAETPGQAPTVLGPVIPASR